MEENLKFHPDLVKKVGKIDRVLADFLKSQLKKTQTALKSKFPEVAYDTTRRLGSAFVTLKGTKEPLSIDQLQEKLPNLSRDQIEFCLTELEEARILRVKDGIYELTHDTLAKTLSELRDPEEVAMLEIIEVLENRLIAHKKTRRGSYLSPEEVSMFKVYEEKIKQTQSLPDEIWQYINDSLDKIRKKEFRKRITRLVFVASWIVLAFFMVRTNVLKANVGSLLTRANALVEQVTSLSLFNKKTADAFKKSAEDRTEAFKNIKTAMHGVPDTLDNELADFLKNNLISEFALYPFYQMQHPSNPPNAWEPGFKKVLIDRELRFCVGLKETGSSIEFWALDVQEETSVDSFIKQSLPLPDTLRGTGNINDLFLAADGKHLITGSNDGLVQQLAINNLHVRDTFYQFDQAINCMAAYGKEILVAIDKDIWMLNPARGRARWIIGFRSPIRSIVVNPDNRGEFAVLLNNSNAITFITRSEDGFSINGEKSDQHVFRETITCIAYAPNGRKMAAGFEGEIGIIWEFRFPDIWTYLRGHRDLISSIAFSPDGQFVLTGSWDKTAILWSSNGNIVKKMVGHSGRVLSAAYGPKNKVITAGEDGLLKYWSLGKGNVISVAKAAESSNDRVRAMAVSPGSKGNLAAFSIFGEPGIFYLWDGEKRTKLEQPIRKWSDNKGEILAMAFTPEGQNLLIAAQNQLVTLIDLQGELKEQYRYPARPRVPVQDNIVSVDVNRDYVLIGNRNRRVDPITGKVSPKKNFALLRKRPNSTAEKEVILLPQQSAVNVVKFHPNPDSTQVLVGCDDGRAYLWNYGGETPQIIDVLQEHFSRITSLDFAAGTDTSFVIKHNSILEKKDTLIQFNNWEYILTGSNDNSANLWKRELWQDSLGKKWRYWAVGGGFKGHASDVLAVDISPDVSNYTLRFLTASADNTVKLWRWNRKTGAFENWPSIIRHLDAVSFASYSGDAHSIFTGSSDRTVQHWRVGKAEDIIWINILAQEAEAAELGETNFFKAKFSSLKKILMVKAREAEETKIEEESGDK